MKFKTEQELMEELMESVYSGKKVESTKPEIIVESTEELRIVRNAEEQDTMESLVESIFSGNVDSDDSDDDDKDDDDKDSDTEDESSEHEESEGDEEEADEESEGDDDSDEDSDDGDKPDFGGDSDGKASGPFTSKIRTLQKQYNDLLVDAFEKYAPECIEDALSETESTFGENIEDILQDALDRLKSKIMNDLGVEGSSDLEGMEGLSAGMPPAAMGSFDPAAGADKPMGIEIQKM
jgi:hypothetical protein